MAKKRADNFITIPFTRNNLDRVMIRTGIKRSLTSNLGSLKGEMLDIGCGKMPYKDFILKNSEVTKYVGLDIESAKEYSTSVLPDYTWDGIEMPFSNESFDGAFGTEVLEHCPDPKIILDEVSRVLKPGGYFFFTVPFLWPLHEVPHDEYRYTPFSLKRHLEQAGFTDIKIQAHGGWHAAMAQMLGLWVKRSGLNRYLRVLLSIPIYILIKILWKWDMRKGPVNFNEGQMITGLSGIAFKK